MSTRRDRAHDFFSALQDRVADALESVDGTGSFRSDTWTRAGGGGGRSRVLADGAVFEKAGVNLARVHGMMSEEFSRQLPGPGRSFYATGLSLVVHPRSPHVPTMHANFRYLEKGEGADTLSWYGGGADLTPWILYSEDVVHFHRVWRDVCNRHAGVADYGVMKRACDAYFHLPHRGESRGVGGIFFDYYGLADDPRGTPADLGALERFVEDAGQAILDAYLPVVDRRKHTPYTDEERAWQLHRRGRYVEFNLLYDRGTTFGLKTGGRPESILMSLPPLVRWSYAHEAAAEGYQAELVDVLRRPRDWLA